MSNQLQAEGGQPQKQTRFAPLHTGRWFQGLYTNRSPLRMGTIAWQTEKYLGGQNDALIGGLNAEISNRLTLVRRPGNPAFPSSANFKNVLRYESFKMFGPAVEQIDVMIDEGPGDLTNGALYEDLVSKHLIFTKSAGAGQTNMAGVGNSLYFGNGIDQKKWLNSITVWPGTSTVMPNAQYPFYSTYLFDTNGAQQQLIAAVLSVSGANSVTIAANGTTVTLKITAGQVASTQVIAGTGTSGTPLLMQGFSTVTQLNGTRGYITNISTNTLTVELTAAVAAQVATTDAGLAIIESGGTPTTGGSTPTWATTSLTPSTTWPYPANVLTHDGTALWINRQNPSSGQVAGIWNWGIAAPTTAPVPQTSTGTAWAANTYFSLDGVVVDAVFNIWGVKVAGTSGSTNPFLTHTTPTSGGIAFSGGTQVTDGTGTLVWECIQAAAAGDHGTTNPGTSWTAGGAWLENFPFVIAGTPKCLFRISPFEQPQIIKALASETNRTTGAYADTYFYDTSGVSNPGIWTWNGTNNTGATGGTQVTTLNSLLFNAGNDVNVQPMQNFPLTQAGVVGAGTTPFAGANERWSMAFLVDINIPQALIDAGGQVSMSVNHDDGFYFGIKPAGGSPPNTSAGTVTLISGANVATGVGVTGLNAYPIIGGINQNGYVANDQYVMQFSAAGTYQFEFDFYQWENAQTFSVFMNGYPNTPVDIAAGAEPLTMTVAPVFPASSTGAAPGYPNVTENISVSLNGGTVPTGGNVVWNNHGPISSMAWAASTVFTLADSTIVDTQGDGEAPYLPGITGSTQPTWTSTLNQLTSDGATLKWINTGPASASAPGTLSTFNGGWRYSIALVNTLDDTVSNIGLVSASTGNFRGSTGITFAAGSGLPPAATLAANPAYNQADYVAIFRTPDEASTGGIPDMFEIPGVNNTPELWTIPLSEYLTNGYTDTTPDVGLDELISAPILQQNTPPAAGAINLVLWLGRIFYSIGNTVYWTSGAAATGNGVNGTSPLNFDEQGSFVKRMVPTAIGLLVFTVSDINLIQKDTAGNILPAIPYIPGRGISTYNAVDKCGTIIGIYTADKVFVTIDPGAGGFNHVSQPIGNLIRQTSGLGTTWDPSEVYVAWHVNGEDQAWYLADGDTGWYRVCQTPSPETGYSWSPFAEIVGGVQAVQSIETSPGVHNLLLGPLSTSRKTLNRDLDTFTDDTTAYDAFAQVGSIVFVHPGQVAEVAFIETDSVLIGTPLTLGVIFDEAVPYYTGPFETLKIWETDPTNQPQSRSILGQRFYTMDAKLQNGAICRHMQLEIRWGRQAVQNEVATMTIFGALMQEI